MLGNSVQDVALHAGRAVLPAVAQPINFVDFFVQGFLLEATVIL